MKKNLIIFSALAAIALLSGSCRKDMADNTPTTGDLQSTKATMQVYNGVLNSARNFVYVNSSPVNGATLAFGSVFPASSYGFSVFNGDNNFTIKDTSSTTTQAAQNFLFTTTAGTNYTVFTYDTITSPKRLIVANQFDMITDNTARVRFVNLIYNPTNVAVDLFSVNTNSLLATGINVGQITNFMVVAPNIADTWQVRQSGNGVLLATLAVGTSTINPGRYYTVAFRGSYRVSANRGVSIFTNR